MKNVGSCVILIVCWIQLVHGGIFPDKYGVVMPNDPFIYIGKNLSLLCKITTNNSNAESSQMTFKKGGFSLDRKYITNLGNQAILLQQPITSLQDEGMYTCYLNGGRQLLLGLQYVRVEYPMEAVKSVECRVFNQETNLLCTWTTIPYHHNDIIQSRLSFRIEYPTSIRGYGEWQPCLNSSMNSCLWQSGEFLYHFNISMVINTTNSVTGDSVKSQQFSISPRHCIEPDSVSDLQVTKVNSSCFMLVWNTETEEFNQLVYKLLITSQWDQHIQELKTEENNMTSCQLIPHTTYTINITCRVVDVGSIKSKQMIGWWSEPEILHVTTHQAAPRLTPESCTGCFSFLAGGQVIIYFQTLKAQDWYGTERQYIVNVTNMATGIRNSYLKPSTSNSITLSLSEVNHAICVKIYTMNSIGISKKFTYFYIPQINMAPRLPSDMMLQMVNQTNTLNTYHLTWKTTASIYTLYWCSHAQENTQCLGEVLWRELDSQRNDHYFEIAHSPSDIPLIGVSTQYLHTGGRVYSSGIHWQYSIFTADKDMDTSDSAYNVFVIVLPLICLLLILIFIVSCLCRNTTKGTNFKPVYPKRIKEFELISLRNDYRHPVPEVKALLSNDNSKQIELPPETPNTTGSSVPEQKVILTNDNSKQFLLPPETPNTTGSSVPEQKVILTNDNSKQFLLPPETPNTTGSSVPEQKVILTNDNSKQSELSSTIPNTIGPEQKVILTNGNSPQLELMVKSTNEIYVDATKRQLNTALDCPQKESQDSVPLSATYKTENPPLYVPWNSYSKFVVAENSEEESDIDISLTEENCLSFEDMPGHPFVDIGSNLEMIPLCLLAKVKHGDT